MKKPIITTWKKYKMKSSIPGISEKGRFRRIGDQFEVIRELTHKSSQLEFLESENLAIDLALLGDHELNRTWIDEYTVEITKPAFKNLFHRIWLQLTNKPLVKIKKSVEYCYGKSNFEDYDNSPNPQQNPKFIRRFEHVLPFPVRDLPKKKTKKRKKK